MICMGIRAAPKRVTFAIFNSDDESVLNVEDIIIPAAFKWPEALKYVRNAVLDVMREYDVAKAGIRTVEPMAQNPSSDRVQVEGVIQEAFASSSLKNYFAGPIAVGAHMLRIDRADFKPMVNAGRNDLDIGGWGDISEAQREAILYAMGAANA